MARILQLRIELAEVTPKIWRQFLVKDNISFQELHGTIQTVMGWEDYHMHEFQIGKETITSGEGFNPAEGALRKVVQSPEFIKMLEQQGPNSPTLDINEVNKILKDSRENQPKQKFSMNTKISELIKTKGQKFIYTYDFGDNWEHIIKVEKVLTEDAQRCPTCLAGKRACPPEDCGSVYGYYEMQEIQKDKDHPKHEEKILGWLGEDHDFEYFNIEEINEQLYHEKRSDGRSRFWTGQSIH